MGPERIDILVADFCCEEYPTLNNVRKSLQEKGESGYTLFALLAYMKNYHLRMAVAENDALHFNLDNYETEDISSVLQAIIRNRQQELQSFKDAMQLLLKEAHWLDVTVE